MSLKQILIILVAGAAAVLAAFLVRGLAAPAAPSGPAETQVVIEEVEVSETQVLVTSRDLEVGELVTPDDVRWANWPESAVNANHFTNELNPEAIEELTGSVIRTRLYENEPLLPQKLVQKGETGYMAALLSPGMRAISVEISSETAASGFILPDDRVDVIMTHEVQFQSGATRVQRPVTTTILENARILAIDSVFTQEEGEINMTGQVATLELGPKEAELLALGERMGTLSLSLRSVADANAAGGVTTGRLDLLKSGGTGGVAVYKNGKSSYGAQGGS